MEMDDHGRIDVPAPARGPRREGRPFALKLTGFALVLIGTAAASGFLMAPWLRQPSEGESKPKPPAGPGLFRGWPKPDVALLLSGEQHGYLQPCGCSEPQKGGLARRYNFLQTLVKERGWPVVAGDLGDVAQQTGPQARLKYKYSLEALKLLGYTAVGVGENEVALPLIDGLADFALNNPSPRVLAANLVDKATNFPNMWFPAAVSDGKDGAPRVGFVGVLRKKLATQAATQLGNGVVAEAAEQILPGVLAGLAAQKPELLVLLYQGPPNDAQACALKFPQFQVVLCLCKEEEPSSRPVVVGNTLVLSVGHKGRYVGVVGANRTGQPGKPFDLRYELVEIGPEYESPKDGGRDNPVHGLMENYAREVKAGNYLAQYVLDAKHPMQISFPEATYVGSDKCKKCHEPAYDVWKAHPHSRAYETLVKATRPSHRQFDGECVVCHTTGFGYQGGFRDEQATPHLKGVGCESCHGPASLHVKNPKNLQVRAVLNPIKRQPGEDLKQFSNRLFTHCRKCHDDDNSVHFEMPEYWDKKKTEHPTPKDE